MAKIFVVGGSGRVASELIKNLINDGNQVFASSRHPEKIIKLDNVVPVKLDLHSDVSAWSEVFKGMDVIYFVAGSRGKDYKRMQWELSKRCKQLRTLVLKDI